MTHSGRSAEDILRERQLSEQSAVAESASQSGDQDNFATVQSELRRLVRVLIQQGIAPGVLYRNRKARSSFLKGTNTVEYSRPDGEAWFIRNNPDSDAQREIRHTLLVADGSIVEGQPVADGEPQYGLPGYIMKTSHGRGWLIGGQKDGFETASTWVTKDPGSYSAPIVQLGKSEQETAEFFLVVINANTPSHSRYLL